MYDRDGADRGNELEQLEREQQTNVQKLAQKQREFQMLMNLQPQKVHRFKIKSSQQNQQLTNGNSRNQQGEQHPYKAHFQRFDTFENQSSNSNIYEVSKRNSKVFGQARRVSQATGLDSPKDTNQLGRANNFNRFKADFQENKEIQQDFRIKSQSRGDNKTDENSDIQQQQQQQQHQQLDSQGRAYRQGQLKEGGNKTVKTEDVIEARETLIENYGKRKPYFGQFSRKTKWFKDDLWDKITEERKIELLTDIQSQMINKESKAIDADRQRLMNEYTEYQPVYQDQIRRANWVREQVRKDLRDNWELLEILKKFCKILNY